MSAQSKVRARVQINPAVVKRAQARMEERAVHVGAHRISVGIHEADGAQEKIGYDGKGAGISLAGVAAAHEFGKGVPNRSWLRTWFDQNRSQLIKDMVETARREYTGEADAFEKQAKAWESDLRDWIEYHDGSLQALAPSTVAEKQRAGLSSPQTPLFATGQLVAAIKSLLDEG